MKTRLRIAATSLIASMALSGAACAGPATEMANAHFSAIGAGSVDKIGENYSDTTVFEWVGGPLDGTYVGKDSIMPVWQKFTEAQGKLDAQVTDLEESTNPAGATVTANVKFVGKNTVPVRYVLTYRGDRLVSETWQIDPKLGSK